MILSVSSKLMREFVIGITVIICIIVTVNAQDACFQKPEIGNCRGSIPRFYFDARSGRCDIFQWGGCGGNGNNFRSLGDCSSFRNYCLRRKGFQG